MQIKRYSDGAVVYDEEAEQKLNETRRERLKNFSTQHSRSIEKIAEAREAMNPELSPTQRHDQALERYQYEFADLESRPGLTMRVFQERQAAIEAANKRGVAPDWDKIYPEIGERVRKNAGIPSTAEREHAETFAELKRGRGQE